MLYCRQIGDKEGLGILLTFIIIMEEVVCIWMYNIIHNLKVWRVKAAFYLV